MYIQTHTKRVGEKTYQSVLLVEGYRENGKVNTEPWQIYQLWLQK